MTEGIPEKNKEQKEGLNLKILLADDEPSILIMSSFVLRGLGCTVETAKTGKELLEKFETGTYDLIITDNTMPEMNGIDAIRRVRSGDKSPNIPIILNSGDMGDIQRRAEELGAVFIEKPFSPQNLEEAVLRATQK